MKTMLSKLTSALLCLAMLLTMCSFAMAEAGTFNLHNIITYSLFYRDH